MRVVATAVGFYKGSRKRPGQEFDVPEGTKGKWFVKGEDAPKKSAVDPKAKGKKGGPGTFSEIARGDAKTVPPGSGDDLT
jgi:hypothetical protein